MQYIVVVCTLVVGALIACSSACNIFERGLSGWDEQIVVNKHNELRDLISQGRVPGQPRGVNLKRIHYDGTLAQRAQELSDTCVFAHRIPSDGRWHAVGQNLYMSMSTGFGKGADWAGAIQSWFDEYKYYSYGGPVNGQNGHYTQLVWANTEFVGCGYTYLESSDFYKYRKLYACNYGPAGNYAGQLPYAT